MRGYGATVSSSMMWALILGAALDGLIEALVATLAFILEAIGGSLVWLASLLGEEAL